MYVLSSMLIQRYKNWVFHVLASLVPRLVDLFPIRKYPRFLYLTITMVLLLCMVRAVSRTRCSCPRVPDPSECCECCECCLPTHLHNNRIQERFYIVTAVKPWRMEVFMCRHSFWVFWQYSDNTYSNRYLIGNELGKDHTSKRRILTS